jgi:hypothetical protein
MHKNATKCNKTLSKWCKNKHGALKIIDTFETYQLFKKAKGYAPKLVSLILPTPTPSTTAPGTSAPSSSTPAPGASAPSSSTPAPTDPAAAEVA